jgi:hypothetical protein
VVSPEPVTPVVACADCNDNNACTLDSCDTTRGVCGHDLLNCDDGNPCTLDSCDATTGCLSAPVPDGTACDDGDACTTDQCDPMSGCMHVIDSRSPDGDGDAVTDACDNCPTLYNPGQNPDDCLQSAHELTVRRSSASGKGSGTINWTTTHEFNISGFNVQGQERDGTYARLNPTPIPCLQCITGQGATYAFTVPKLKSGRNLFIQMLGGTGALIGIFGPAPDPGDRAGLTRD